jgi:hypothetical protein
MAKLLGVILIVVGLVGLVWGGITYTTQEKVVDIGPIHASREKTHNVPLPPIAGAVAVIGGIALFVAGRKWGTENMLILLVILILLLGGGGGYYGYGRWGYGGGAGAGLGTVLLILLVAYLLGVFHWVNPKDARAGSYEWLRAKKLPNGPARPLQFGSQRYLFARCSRAKDIKADECVVGAGITGLTTAYLLTDEGQSVVVLDDGPIAGGETSRTTAHSVNALDDRYFDI